MSNTLISLIPLLLLLVLYGGIVAFAIYLLVLLTRVAKAQERTALALEEIARKLYTETKP
jgi:hypothetical protein